MVDRRSSSPSDGIPYPGLHNQPGWTMSGYADGVPTPGTTTPIPVPDFDDDEGSRRETKGRWGRRSFNRILAFEGPRGHATRATVWMRNFAFLAEVVILSAITGWLTNGVTWASGGGKWMLIAATVMLVAAAFATMRHPNERNNIIREARKYVLAIALRPATGIAAFIWGTKEFFTQQTDNAMTSLLANATPIVFFTTLFIPVLVFVKFVFGLGQLNRSMEDNQTLVARWTRQDGMQK